MTKRTIPLGALITLAIIIYICGIFTLALASFVTGGANLFGVQPHGLGAVVDVLLTAWMFMFPFVFCIWYVGFYGQSRSKSSKKSKREDDRYIR